MTYFGFLIAFVGIPLLVLGGITLLEQQRGMRLAPALRTWPAWAVLAGHVLLALAYTTPWDNYLVATRVWWYDPARVTGVTLGWVPLEEYLFFVIQTLLTGLWLLWLGRHLALPNGGFQPSNRLRTGTTAALAILWLACGWLLFSGWRPSTYLALELVWALVPILLQIGFGADILWHYRKLVFWALVPPTLYLSAADAVAIDAGTWTIDPAQSLNILVGPLPLEEFLFFLLTNTLVVFGMTLMLSRESHRRARLSRSGRVKRSKLSVEA